jgi:aryl-alcohol dehydrogenase-like predicted oxidoreductase
MEYRTLGRTGLRVSALAFGAGPVSGLLTGDDPAAQLAVVRRAVEVGINWFDTAAGYGLGRSEANLGRALREAAGPGAVHVATKVRLAPDQFADARGHVRRSVEASLARLGVSAVTLLQLHNGITAGRGDEPFSVTPGDVLGGVLDAFQELKAAGLIQHVGLTGTGRPDALREVVRSGAFDTIQVPYHLLNPSAGRAVPAGFAETDHGNVIADCAAAGMGVFAIRVFAGGALLDNPPSAHTRTTPFFPLALYERDRRRAARLAAEVARPMPELALRYALSHPGVHAAIVGFGTPDHVDEAATAVRAGPLPGELLRRLEAAAALPEPESLTPCHGTG